MITTSVSAPSALPSAPSRPDRRSPTGGSHVPGSRAGGFWLYLIPGLVLFAAIILVPFGWNLYLSFTSYRGVKPPEWIGLDNWQRLLGDGQFWASFGNSIAMIVAMVVVPTLLGLLIAAVLFDLVARSFGGKVTSFLRATYYLPQILPIAVAAVVIGWILRVDDGALNEVLRAVGLGNLANNWLGSPDTALLSIMVVLVWVQLGYPVVIFMAALQRVDPELYDAAALDGASWWQRFRVITVTVIRPEVFVVTLTCTIAALKVFGPVYLLTRGGPGTSTIVPSYYSYSQFFQTQQVGYGATIATALTAVVILVTVVFIHVQHRSERRDGER